MRSPPGLHLLDELEAREIPFEEFRRTVPGLGTAEELRTGKTAITNSLAHAIGDALGMSGEIWLRLELKYRDSVARGIRELNAENIEAAQAKAAAGGKLLLRLPVSLHQRVSQIAKSEGVSLNQLLLSYIAEGLGRSDQARR